jgi:hypothetical protein
MPPVGMTGNVSWTVRTYRDAPCKREPMMLRDSTAHSSLGVAGATRAGGAAVGGEHRRQNI